MSQPIDEPALRELIDQAEIRRVIERYFSCLDRQQPAGLAEVFTEDAVITYFGGASRRSARDVVAGGPPPFTHSSHILANTSIACSGDTATADTGAVAILAFEGAGTLLIRGLRYLDRLVRTPAGWRIQEREHRALWESAADLRAPSSAEALQALRLPGR